MLLGSAQQHPVRPPVNLERSIFAQKKQTETKQNMQFFKVVGRERGNILQKGNFPSIFEEYN